MNSLHDFLDQTYPPKSVRVCESAQFFLILVLCKSHTILQISARGPPGGPEDMEVEFSLKDLLMVRIYTIIL
jgi:hypothetical protein